MCRLFKKISIKLPGWLRAAPISSAHAPSHPIPLREARISVRGFFIPFPGNRTSHQGQQAAEKCGAWIGPWPKWTLSRQNKVLLDL